MFERRNTCRSISHIGHNSTSKCSVVPYLHKTSVPETQLQNNITSAQSRLMSTTGILILLANGITEDERRKRSARNRYTMHLTNTTKWVHTKIYVTF